MCKHLLRLEHLESDEYRKTLPNRNGRYKGSSVSRERIHRSTTENFCLDEIRPRDWLNVTRPLSLRRKNKILWPTRWMAFDNTNIAHKYGIMEFDN